MFMPYLVITNPDGGHTDMTAAAITLKQANALCKKEGYVGYVFKVPKIMYSNYLFKLPLSDHYDCTRINTYTQDVWVALNVVNAPEPDFAEYAEVVVRDDGECTIACLPLVRPLSIAAAAKHPVTRVHIQYTP